MSESLEFLRFAALSTAVHADALQCLVDDTHSALYQMSTDVEQLEALEGELSILLKEQRRLNAMRDVLSRSRSARCGTESNSVYKELHTGMVTKTNRGSVQPSSCSASPPSIDNVLQFASSALGEDDVATVTKAVGRGRSAPKRAKVKDEEERTVDEEVERMKLKIQLLESMSIKAKLRELESLKQHIKELDANAIMDRYVGSFCFTNDVEDLWNTKNILSSKNIDLLITRACQRFSARYEDALTAVSDFSMSEKSDATQVFSSLLYAEALTSSQNYDAGAVRTFQNLGKESLLQYYTRMKQMATVDTVVRRSRVETVLGPEEFNALPEDWWSTQLLLIPVDAYLPPARHILTRRFSFADVNELKVLQSLRVKFQRDILDAFICLPKAIDEFRHRVHVEPTQQEEERDHKISDSATLVRVMVGKEDTSSGGGVWTTLAHCTPES